MIYLATPYSHPEHHIRQWRAELVTHVAGMLMQCGLQVFSPITHGHAIASVVPLPTNFAYWSESCHLHLRNCDRLVVLCLPGWRESVGVASEMALASELGLPVAYLDLDDEIEARNEYDTLCGLVEKLRKEL